MEVDVNVKWRVRVTTGDHHGLFHLLHKANPEWRERGIDGMQRMHDDDPDSDVSIDIEVKSLAELCRILDVIGKAQYVSGLIVAVLVESHGVDTWATIGCDWMNRKDGVNATMCIRDSVRQDEAHHAIKEAMQILSSVE